MMHSCIYEGSVRHRRFSPVGNVFHYRLFLLYLDLTELPTLFDPYRFWSYQKANVASFYRKHHLGNPEIPLDTTIRDVVAQQTGARPAGPIRMLTHLQYFGYCFNPVCFYYCYDQAGQELETIVAEVHNTPWGETHPYVLSKALNEHPDPEWRRYQFAKNFHVSPFIDMDIWYDWKFRVPGHTLNVHLNDLEHGKKIFDATLTLQRREINSQSLNRVLIAYPLMTIKVITLIHWQALRLWWKGATFYTHPGKREKS
ncbi:hypothetical protein U27_03494 [Candidatus Vecturithrix granuli]|uniref:Chromosome partitioning protein ParA n=1 Tax=Vecturithrix granuli TaxID=1499967 RepID=A0A081BW27_VECG1|nr:hypothetical protein U27_03494 [Candidatus Vecturithrix granuli]